MSLPAIMFGDGLRKRRTLTSEQQKRAKLGLCTCPDCCRQRPERVTEVIPLQRSEYRIIARRLGAEEVEEHA